MTKTRFLDIHVLHPVPFSNLNRDNLGTPKQVTYGNSTRSRISSQCAKRAARLWLEANTDLDAAVRTRRLPEMVRKELRASGFSDDDARAAVKVMFWSAGIAVKGGADENDPLHGNQLTFTTVRAAERLAAIAGEHKDAVLAAATARAFVATGVDDDEDAQAKSNSAKREKGEKPKSLPATERRAAPWSSIAAVFAQHNAIISLCGRMLADMPDTNVDGALQVAHAFTTHTGIVEPDYFTAVDDTNPAEETGAGHIGVNEFTSGVFYRHATIDLESLRDSLASESHNGSDDTAASVAAAFVRAFTVAEPTGKQNAANAHTRPALIAVAARSDRPVSHAAAFEAPVLAAREGGYAAASASRLNEHVAADNDLYGTEGLNAAWHAVRRDVLDSPLDSLGEDVRSLDALTTAVEAHLRGAP